MSWEDLTDEDLIQSNSPVEDNLLVEDYDLEVTKKQEFGFLSDSASPAPLGYTNTQPQAGYGSISIQGRQSQEPVNAFAQPVRILKRQEHDANAAKGQGAKQEAGAAKVVSLEDRQKSYMEARKRIFQT